MIFHYSPPVSIQGKDTEDTAEYILDNDGSGSFQEFIDGTLAENAGSGLSEWYVIALIKGYESLDFTLYHESIKSYIAAHKEILPTDAERIALALAAMGSDDEWIADVIDTMPGQRGIMSIIYGLMLKVYGNYDTETTVNGLAAKLVEYQADDGGFSVSGQKSDVDVTAMALQALAPLDREYADEIEKAVGYLLSERLESGGYRSMGVENLESAAQVLLAFTALNDYENASITYRYILSQKNEDGGFPHAISQKSNPIAVCQCFLALTAYERMNSGKSFIYDNRSRESGNSSSSGSSTARRPEITGKQIKIIIMVSLAVVAAAAYLYMIIRKRLNLKKAVYTGMVFAALITAAGLSEIETPEEHYNRETSGDCITSLTITGCYDTVILETADIYIDEGGTVFDQLMNASIKYGIDIDYGGSTAMGNIYVKGINGLYEFDYGNNSGWTYTVNGIYMNVSAAQCTLGKNDKVEWKYTQNGGG